NPFLLAELAASPEPSPTLRLALRARLDRCSTDAHRSMSLLALLGRSATRKLIGHAVDELVEAGLVNVREDGFEPRHALLAESAGRSQPPSRAGTSRCEPAPLCCAAGRTGRGASARTRSASSMEGSR